jgi:transcriptional regulator with XRE-family HTH domain
MGNGSESNDGLGSMLRNARRGRGVSQAALARRTGIPQPAISRIENGREAPSMERLSRVLAGLGLRPMLVLAPLAEHTGDPRHGEAVGALSPGERLEQATAWIDLFNEMHGRARDGAAASPA